MKAIKTVNEKYFVVDDKDYPTLMKQEWVALVFHFLL
jgi:hypothetical protein